MRAEQSRAEQSRAERLSWLDVLKGIGIILVAIGHIYSNRTIFNWLYSFHMPLFFLAAGWVYKEKPVLTGYRQVLCANSFTSLAELSLHRAGKPALNYLVAEDRERVKGGEAACEALDVNSVFCYQPASSSCISMCFMLMYFFPPHWVEPRHMELNLSGGCHEIAIVMTDPITLPLFAAFITSSLCQLLRFCFQQAI